jgi:hypothetical protein
MKYVLVILFLISIVFASCNEEPKPLNITKIENKKPTIDDLISTTIVRNLRVKDIRNIDSLRGYKMLKLGLRIDDIDSGSFESWEFKDGNLKTLYRRQDKEVVKLSFYKRILVRIEIENETIKTLRPNIDGDGIFVWQEDLLNTFGEPNIKKSTIKSKVNELPKTTLNLIWQSKNNLVIQYVLKESTVFRHSPPRFIGDDEVILEDAGTERSFVYSITDNSLWKIYEKERNYAVEKEKSEERILKKKKDSLRIISSQNNL